MTVYSARVRRKRECQHPAETVDGLDSSALIVRMILLCLPELLQQQLVAHFAASKTLTNTGYTEDFHCTVGL